MKILLTGVTGYIGKRLLSVLVSEGHHVVCMVRDKTRFNPEPELLSGITILEADLLKKQSLEDLPDDLDAAYYLVHSMASSRNYSEMEKQCAINFRTAVEKTQVKQVLYLSGIVNERNLSPHLASRKTVEDELGLGTYALTCLRAGIIIGSGSASFEIMRDIVEKLPIMITPKWLLTKCQPIAVADVLRLLYACLHMEQTYGRAFDIGGDDVLTYKEMLVGLAEERKLKRYIFIVPIMTPRLSSYWLYFVTSTSYSLATSLVDSMKVEVVCNSNELKEMLNIRTMSYREALSSALDKLRSNAIASSWINAYSSSNQGFTISEFTKVPEFGCFKDERKGRILDRSMVLNRLWKIGGQNGWYYGNWLWRLRGFVDKVIGGVGLRRGRTNQTEISSGDALDFWRVLVADKAQGRLLLFAEMKLPGDAWLEFKFEDDMLVQTATFRPRGLAGRLYWLLVYPFHGFIFQGMLNALLRTPSE